MLTVPWNLWHLSLTICLILCEGHSQRRTGRHTSHQVDTLHHHMHCRRKVKSSFQQPALQNPLNIKSEMRSFKSNENIHKKEGGSYYVVSANKASSVAL